MGGAFRKRSFFGRFFSGKKTGCCFVFMSEYPKKEDAVMNRNWKRMLSALAAGLMTVLPALAEDLAPEKAAAQNAAASETAGEKADGEATVDTGFSEIESLLDASRMTDTEGMTLEEITDAFNNGAMKEFLNQESGFSVQYPALFEFQDNAGYQAVSGDGLAILEITSVPNGGEKLLKSILEITKNEVKDARTEYQPEAGILLLKRTDDDTAMVYADLYLETSAWLHHVSLMYPRDQDPVYDPYLMYILNSMTSGESEQG